MPDEPLHTYELVVVDKTDQDHLIMTLVYETTRRNNALMMARIAMLYGKDPFDFLPADCGCPEDGSEHPHV